MSHNVYADMGYPDAEAMLLKAGTVVQLSDSIAAHRLSIAAAARLIGIPKSVLASLVEGDFATFSLEQLNGFIATVAAAPVRRLPAPMRHRGYPIMV